MTMYWTELHKKDAENSNALNDTRVLVVTDSFGSTVCILFIYFLIGQVYTPYIKISVGKNVY